MNQFSLPSAACIGYGTIDAEHQDIIDFVNSNVRLLRQGPRRDIVGLFEPLRHLMAHHFRNEEQLMRDTGFPGLIGHRGQHEGLLLRIDDLWRLCAARGRVDLNDAVTCFDSVIDDILRADLPFKTFLHEQGILR
ncbi:MAG TPA: hemerythrin family protein [Ferrovibrio sp.]|uniref:bacteriohemerythrin n=1 Tax=Ferrovibrio sp. TaxID=1917215 RepID=UPI002ED1875C